MQLAQFPLQALAPFQHLFLPGLLGAQPGEHIGTLRGGGIGLAPNLAQAPLRLRQAGLCRGQHRGALRFVGLRRVDTLLQGFQLALAGEHTALAGLTAMGAQPIAAEPDTLRRHQGLAGREFATAGLGLGAALGAAHASEQAGDARVAAQAMRERIGGQRQGRGRRLEQGHIAFGQGLKGRAVSLDSIDTNTLERAAKDRLHGGLPARLDLQGVENPRARIELLAAQKIRHALAVGARFGGLLQGLQRRAPPALHL